jgi:hypothetical protein
LRHLSLANVRIEGDQALSTIKVDIETETASYFVASKHKLSVFFCTNISVLVLPTPIAGICIGKDGAR